MTEKSKSLIRNILAVLAGLTVGVALIMLVQTIGHSIYPATGTVDMNDEEAMRAFVAALPAGALWFVIASYFFGSMGGAAVAAAISRNSKMRLALLIGFVLLLSGLANLVMIPHPFWFSLVTVLVFIPAAWLGGWLVSRGAATTLED